MLRNREMDEYRRTAHAVSDVKCHILWITKYRNKVLKDESRSGHGMLTDKRARREMH